MKSINEFRISKYDISKRMNGFFQDIDWTSFSDIGKVYHDKELTLETYLQVENAYLWFIESICSTLGITQMEINSLEDPRNRCIHKDGSFLLSVDEILNVSRDCLREYYWCRIEHPRLFLHFGYDYYLYVGSKLNFVQIKNIASEYGLYTEIKSSPYRINT